jgi:twitching motility protein PilT
MAIEKLLQAARKAGASDIHLVAGVPPAFRVNGEILPGPGDAMSRADVGALVRQVLSERQWADFERDREICVSVTDPTIGRMRVTVYLHAGSAEAAIRLCYLKIPSSQDLGLPRVVDELTRKSSGLVLIAGPTGVGKTTTLNYMVDLINREQRVKIVTIEDPVEYVHEPKKAIVVQQELHTDVTTYARALRHVLRQDPNVIVVGEMRDLDTIETAIQAAETGHLVLATLHTPFADQTIERIVSTFPAERQGLLLSQLASSLQGILAQLLLPRADRKGRVLAAEILLANNAIRNQIREGSAHMIGTTMQTSAREGMRTMDAALLDLWRTGTITWDVALNHARNPGLFRKSREEG